MDHVSVFKDYIKHIMSPSCFCCGTDKLPGILSWSATFVKIFLLTLQHICVFIIFMFLYFDVTLFFPHR